jgi:hypothetical protein
LLLYRPDVFNAHSKRLDPHCATCGETVGHQRSPDQAAPASRGHVLVINGTCASGKSTISYLLSEHHGFIQVDGDWILHRTRQQNPKAHADEIHEDLARLAADLVDTGRSVALAHIIPPEHLGVYRLIFAELGIRYGIVILMPRVPVLLSRNETRKCWPKTTPEYWVMKFHDEFQAASEDLARHFHDNTDETELETAASLSTVAGDLP